MRIKSEKHKKTDSDETIKPDQNEKLKENATDKKLVTSPLKESSRKISDTMMAGIIKKKIVFNDDAAEFFKTLFICCIKPPIR